MRILVVADIHANWPALAAIQEPFDACLCVGDLVEYGPQPREVVSWVRANCARTVRGNHDHGVAQNVDVFGVGGFRYLTMATRKPTIRMLGAADRRYLADLPTMDLFNLGGKRFALVHATPRDPLDEYVLPDQAAWTQRVAGLNADFVCVGHTHAPFVLTCGKTTVLNPGSVGLSRDGSPLARYAIIDGDEVQLKAVEYPIEETIAAVTASDLDPRAKKMLADVYRNGRMIHPGTNGTNGHHVNGK
jgi:putative phosphoesterase